MSREKAEIAITALLGQPLEAGSLVKAELFEELLGLKRTRQAFWRLIHEIRVGLYEHGIYLSGEGFSETGAFEIAHPRDNYWYARVALERAERNLEGKQTLLLNTQMGGFSQIEKRRHENMLREISMRLDAMRRAVKVQDILSRPKLRARITKSVAATQSAAELSEAERGIALPSEAELSNA